MIFRILACIFVLKKLQQPTSSAQEFEEQSSPAEKHTSDVKRPLIHSEDLTWDSKSDTNAESQSQTYSRRTNNGNIFTPILTPFRGTYLVRDTWIMAKENHSFCPVVGPWPSLGPPFEKPGLVLRLRVAMAKRH
jgi:hypothetical protein